MSLMDKLEKTIAYKKGQQRNENTVLCKKQGTLFSSAQSNTASHRIFNK
jgi:hypothetical protein